jgi:hypothetical protein
MLRAMLRAPAVSSKRPTAAPTLFGVGGVFVIGVATLLLGIVLMAAWNLLAPAFFRGETFTREWAEAHEPELTELRSG